MPEDPVSPGNHPSRKNEVFDWRKHSSDPNSASVSRARQNLLDGLRSERLLPNRLHHLCGLASGKKVLDVGCVEHDLEATSGDDWLHRHLVDVAAECLGVDILAAEIQELSDRGYSVVCHDLLAGPLDDTFDLIVCGELLEHVTAPEDLLRSAAVMLRPGGIVVVTTPNPWYVNPMFKSAFGRSTFVDSADHVAWYDPSTMLELAARAGLGLTFFGGIAASPTGSLSSRLFFGLGRLWLLLGVRRELMAKTLVYHLAR